MTTRNVRKVAEKAIRILDSIKRGNMDTPLITNIAKGRPNVYFTVADLRLLAEFVKEKTKC